MTRKKAIIIIIMTAILFLFLTIYLCICIFSGYQKNNLVHTAQTSDTKVETEAEDLTGEVLKEFGQVMDIESTQGTETKLVVSEDNKESAAESEESEETEEIEYKPISAFTVGDATPAESTAPSVYGITNTISFCGMDELDKILPIEAQYHIVTDTQKFLIESNIQGKVLTPDKAQTVQRENEIIYVCTVDSGEMVASKYIIDDDIFEFSINVEELLAQETEAVTAETVNADN